MVTCCLSRQAVLENWKRSVVENDGFSRETAGARTKLMYIYSLSREVVIFGFKGGITRIAETMVDDKENKKMIVALLDALLL